MSPKRGPQWVPKLGRFGPRSCGRVRIPGRGDIYLGEAGCWPASRKKPPLEVIEAYNREIARWTAARAEGRDEAAVGPGCTINQLVDAYRKHCKVWYRKRGQVTSQVPLIARAVREVRRLFGTTPAADFSSRDLRTVREQFERTGTQNRATINAHISRIRRMFRWGVEEDLLPEDTWLRLQVVSGLKKGRTTAREPGKVLPVSAEIVAATLPHLPAVVQALVQVQYLGGMRPEEACYMQAGDVTVEDGVWRYAVRDDANKLAHKGIARTVYLGPQAQAILRPWLEAALAVGPEAWVFPKRLGRGPMTPENFQLIVSRACKNNTLPHWSPGQLRHSAATDIRKIYGIEAVQATLGHTEITTSQVYALKSEELAKKIAREIG